MAEPLAVTRTPADVDLQAGIPLAQTLPDGRGTSAAHPTLLKRIALALVAIGLPPAQKVDFSSISREAV